MYVDVWVHIAEWLLEDVCVADTLARWLAACAPLRSVSRTTRNAVDLVPCVRYAILLANEIHENERANKKVRRKRRKMAPTVTRVSLLQAAMCSANAEIFEWICANGLDLGKKSALYRDLRMGTFWNGLQLFGLKSGYLERITIASKKKTLLCLPKIPKNSEMTEFSELTTDEEDEEDAFKEAVACLIATSPEKNNMPIAMVLKWACEQIGLERRHVFSRENMIGRYLAGGGKLAALEFIQEKFGFTREDFAAQDYAMFAAAAGAGHLAILIWIHTLCPLTERQAWGSGGFVLLEVFTYNHVRVLRWMNSKWPLNLEQVLGPQNGGLLRTAARANSVDILVYLEEDLRLLDHPLAKRWLVGCKKVMQDKRGDESAYSVVQWYRTAMRKLSKKR